MVDPQLVERLREDAHGVQPGPFAHAGVFASPLCRIETLAYAMGQKAPEALAEASEILALVTVAKSAGPSRDEIAEAIEEVCGDELSGCCVSRIADAVMKLYRAR
jgi:hypothetical protein